MTDHTDIVERMADAAHNIAWMDGRSIDVAFSAMHEASAEITRLRAEAEALRKDAERYRWLRRVGWAEETLYATGPKCWGVNGIAMLSNGQLDDAIDGALDTTKGTT